MAKTDHVLLPFILIILSSVDLYLSFNTKFNFTTDESSLLAIKDHITSDPFHILVQNWSSDTSFCSWVGVSCGARHLRVIALNLSNMGLVGTLSPHIGNLSFLSSLDLSFNNFSGHLPGEIGYLRRLKIIDFTQNNFSGVISSWIGNFFKLESLLLAFNSFTSTIPKEIGNCNNLKTITLNQNKFYGTIPSTMFNLSSLQFLNLSNNSLSGSLSSEMCKNLPNIEILSFMGNKFQGQLPSSIGKCTNLQLISFESNNFTGGIPTSIGRLNKLKKIYLPDNNLKGSIWPMLLNISSLENISLGRNFFSGVFPQDICHKLPMLNYLNIPQNGFTGSIPKALQNCSLIELDLSSNNFTGEIPIEIGNLHDLEYLNVAHNNLYGEIPHAIFNSTKLQFLYLYDNHLSGSLPSDLGSWLPSLQELLPWGNNLNGVIPSTISNASNLILLDFAMNSFSGHIPNSLGNLKQLMKLAVFWNNLTVESSSDGHWDFLSSLTNCNQLSHLDISSNPLNVIFPASSFGNLSNSLEKFFVNDCQLKGSIPIEIENLRNTIILDLSGNEFTGQIPKTIGRIRRLQGLFLNNNKLQGFIPHNLCNLQSLSDLYFNENDLSGPVPSCISKLISLRYLYLSSNNFSSILPTSFWNLKDILELDISSNALEGSIPIEIQNMQAMTLLDLSSNKFSGKIPTTLAGLQNLQNLSLSRNQLQGSIPDSFGSLVSLVSLDLSNNNLSGVIPESLVKLTFLTSFNVSFNKLEGRIPTEGPFKNFFAQSYMENYGLCGSPYLKVSPCSHSFHHEGKSAIVLKFVLPAITTTTLLVLLIFLVMRKKYFRRKTSSSSNNGEIVLTKVTWRILSYQELSIATNGFDDNMLLGVGSFGSVYKGSLSNGMIVAIKVFNLHHEDEVFRSFEVECEVMRNVRHRNLVPIITACYSMDFKALVLQFMPNGSLDTWLNSENHVLEMRQRINIMIDVALALDYLHNWSLQSVVHCDLKPSNVLLDEDMVAHVADFGISKLLSDSDYVTHTITLATFGYMAPEYGLQGNVSTKIDVYSYGILLLEVFTKMKPTNNMFDEEMSLKSWVCRSLPDNVYEVADINLFGETEEQVIRAKRDCVLSIFELALNCCSEHPEQRKNMGDVVNSLKKINEKYLRDVKVTRPSR